MIMKPIDLTSRRRIVIHHTHMLGRRIIDFLHADDIVFFDDCLFSQYNFLKENRDFFENMSIDCILGFSSGLYANEDAIQVHAIESHILHDACNAKIHCLNDADHERNILQEMNGFMKISQIKELLEMPFCHLALHGCCHLKLENENGLLNKLYCFKRDIKEGLERLKSFDLSTSMYVYPYVYSFHSSDNILNSLGLHTIVGSKTLRISIEDLMNGKTPNFSN